MAIWWLCISIGGETWKFDFLSQIWPWRSRSIVPQNNSHLNQVSFHLWSKSGLLSWMGDELWHGQAQNRVNFDFQIKFYLEGQSRPLHKTIGTLIKVFYIFGLNLVILPWTGPQLSLGQKIEILMITEGLNFIKNLSILMKIQCKFQLCPHINSNKLITIKFCIWCVLTLSEAYMHM